MVAESRGTQAPAQARSRAAVVTGASSGIGRATAALLAERGWTVIAVARRAERLESLAAASGVIPFAADLTDQTQVDALAAFVREQGGVHSLVNVAGGAHGSDPVDHGDVDDWEWMYRTNVLATLRVTKALLPLLRENAVAAGSADVLTVTSTAAQVVYEGGAGYTAAKHAEQALVDTLRLELSGEPIRVIAIAPGLVATEEFSRVRLGSEEAAAKVYEGVDHPLTAEDIALVNVQALELPWHINLDLVTVRPVAQAAQHKLFRGPLAPKAAGAGPEA